MVSKKAMKYIALTAVILAVLSLFASCASDGTYRTSTGSDYSKYIRFPDSEPASVDPQIITQNYTVPMNIFDRLVEYAVSEDGKTVVTPSLAKAWTVSDDGLKYTFYLREGVYFSNGSILEADDVLFSFSRLITHPQSKNRNILMCIHGADNLRDGVTSKLEGFEIIDDLTFIITLNHPFPGFIEGLTAPGASIFDRATTTDAGDDFGKIPGMSIGTGPFILEKWTANREIVLTANKEYWGGAPKCDGIRISFYTEADPLREMYIKGEFDLLDLDKIGMDAEYFIHGDDYRKNLVRGDRIGVTYIVLNESVKPLDDVKVRKALQISLDRESILQATAGGRGYIENGIFPSGLKGYDPDLEEIPYDVEAAKALISEAGYSDGFDLDVYYTDTTAVSMIDILRLAATMWSKIGVRANLIELPNEEFLNLRREGKISCYADTWSADYNDPDDFIYTFFGSADNSSFRSICYSDEDVFERVHHARSIIDEDERLEEYRALQRKIVTDDAAWIPLYSKIHYFVVSDRLGGFKVSWNGWSSNRYTGVYLIDEGQVTGQ